MDNAIVLKGVSKKYSLTKERPLLLKNLFIPSKKEEIWALKDVSLEIKKGETIGIIGENGSGKSTLLKIISGITTPTSGKVEVNGRVASLIELGAGFHPDLTGRENVYLNGTLLGLTKKEIDRKYREIVEFADIPEFIDQPVRTYSSGMTVRLGFSVAVHLDSDILLIDEVLAVGDEDFQQKTIDKLLELESLNITILFVSHNLSLIDSFCKRVIWLNKGRVGKDGRSGIAINKYLYNQAIDSVKDDAERGKHEKSKLTRKINISNFKILNSNDKEEKIFKSLEPIKIKFDFKLNKPVYQPMFGIAIFKEDTYIFGSKYLLKQKIKMGVSKALMLDIPECGLLRGDYKISIGVCSNNNWENPYDVHSKNLSFKIIDSVETIQNDGLVHLQSEWKEI